MKLNRNINIKINSKKWLLKKKTQINQLLQKKNKQLFWYN